MYLACYDIKSRYSAYSKSHLKLDILLHDSQGSLLLVLGISGCFTNLILPIGEKSTEFNILYSTLIIDFPNLICWTKLKGCFILK